MPANYERVRSISRIAGADFSGNNPGEYCFCAINPNASVVNGTSIAGGSVILAGAGARALGVLIGKQIPGHAIEVGVGGRLLVIAGAAVVAGNAAASDANGHCIAQTSTNHVLGTILESGNQGDIVSVEFDVGGTG